MLRIISLLMALNFSIGLSARADAPPADRYSQFISGLKDTAVSILTKELDEAKRQAAFCSLVNTNVDIVGMGKFALGRNFRTLSDLDLNSYLAAFRNMLASLMTRAFQEFKNRSVFVDPTARAIGDEFMINVSIDGSGNRRGSRVQFRIVPVSDNTLRLFDASLDGISLLTAKRTDFDQIVRKAVDENRSGAVALMTELNTRYPSCPL